MIAVENTGRGIAEQYVAKLRALKNNSANLENPETGPKILQWSIENNIRENISARTGYSLLTVVFSYEKQQSNKFAFVGTPMSLNGPNPARTEYAFSTGNFDLEVVITTADSSSKCANYNLCNI